MTLALLKSSVVAQPILSSNAFHKKTTTLQIEEPPHPIGMNVKKHIETRIDKIRPDIIFVDVL